LARSAAVISSQTASSSAMKPRTAAEAGNGRQAVRFNDSSFQQSQTDITC